MQPLRGSPTEWRETWQLALQALRANKVRAMFTSVNGEEHPVYLVGVTAGFQKIRNLLVLQGRYLDQDDLRTQSKVCLLTPALANLLFPSESPLGKDIGIGELHFTVIGF